jgi:hypothetical protein
MVNLYTAQYRYSGPDRLDITVKGKDPIGRVFAPTWQMVMKYKQGEIDQDTYSKMYWTLMKERHQDVAKAIQWVLSQREVTLVCFCPAGKFCHRLLVANELSRTYTPSIYYMGERRL